MKPDCGRIAEQLPAVRLVYLTDPKPASCTSHLRAVGFQPIGRSA
jgi:hypothetical protein